MIFITTTKDYLSAICLIGIDYILTAKCKVIHHQKSYLLQWNMANGMLILITCKCEQQDAYLSFSKCLLYEALFVTVCQVIWTLGKALLGIWFISQSHLQDEYGWRWNLWLSESAVVKWFDFVTLKSEPAHKTWNAWRKPLISNAHFNYNPRCIL